MHSESGGQARGIESRKAGTFVDRSRRRCSRAETSIVSGLLGSRTVSTAHRSFCSVSHTSTTLRTREICDLLPFDHGLIDS